MATTCNTPHADRHGRRLTAPAMIALTLLAFAIDLGLGPAPDASPQRPTRERPESEQAEPNAQDTDASDEPAEEPEGPVLAIVGGDIITVTGPVIRKGTVLVRGTRIVEVGQDVEVPEDATVIDASGKTIAPGFIALNSSGVGINTSARGSDAEDLLDPYDRTMKYCLGVGITSACATLPSRRSNSRGRSEAEAGTDPVAADSQADHDHDHNHDHAVGEDDLDLMTLVRPPSDPTLDDYVPRADLALLKQVTRPDPTLAERHGLLADGSGGFCSCCELALLPVPTITAPVPKVEDPQEQVFIKLTYGDVDAMLVAETPTYYVRSSNLAGSQNRYTWRENIKKAREYLDELAEYEEAKAEYEAAKEEGEGDDDQEKPKEPKEPRKPVSDEFLKLVKKEIPLRTDASSIDAIRDMIALAEESDVDLILDEVHEAWLIADELSEADVSVTITPRSRRRPAPGIDESEGGSSIEMASLLEEASVPFAIEALSAGVSLNGLAGRDLTSLPLEAAFAVRGGASEQEALEALTITPARMLGLDDRIGSIEEGKDADLLILDGPPLDYRTYVETTIVDGEVRYERAKDRVFPVFARD